MIWQVILLSTGAVFGACLRWFSGIYLNPIFPAVPMGTVFANLFGGLLMGIVIEMTRTGSYLTEGMNIAITIGFLGSLTTFSTFSGETALMLLKQEYFWAMITIFLHLFGTISLVFAGIFLGKQIFCA
jgi:fluoride exporter